MVLRTLIVLILLCNGLAAVSQDLSDICKLRQNYVDEFTGEVIKETNEMKLAKQTLGASVMYSLRKVDDEYYIIATLISYDCLDDHSAIWIKFSDGAVHKILHIGRVTCSRSAYPGSFPELRFVGKIDDTLMNKLSTDAATRIRIYDFDSYTDYDVKDWSGLMQQARCISRL